MTAEVIYLPLPADDVRAALKRHDDLIDLDKQHWLLFAYSDEHERHVITGCACGFEADVEEDCGYGDTVVDHLLEVGANAAR